VTEGGGGGYGYEMKGNILHKTQIPSSIVRARENIAWGKSDDEILDFGLTREKLD